MRNIIAEEGMHLLEHPPNQKVVLVRKYERKQGLGGKSRAIKSISSAAIAMLEIREYVDVVRNGVVEANGF